MTVSWSGVSMKGNASSSSRCHGVSGGKECPRDAMRAEYSFTSSTAMSRTARRALPFAAAQSLPPILVRAGSSPPT